jgi:hypothetical protein
MKLAKSRRTTTGRGDNLITFAVREAAANRSERRCVWLVMARAWLQPHAMGRFRWDLDDVV